MCACCHDCVFTWLYMRAPLHLDLHLHLRSTPDLADDGASIQAQDLLTDGSLAQLEDAIRDALRARRSVYEDSKTTLLKLFK